MALDELHPFPELPVELVQTILETSAILDRATALALVQVSHAVKHWIEPILYTIVALPSKRRYKAFTNLVGLPGSEAESKMVDRMRALHIPLDSPGVFGHFWQFRSVRHLALNCCHLDGKESEVAPVRMRPSRLVLFGFSLTSPQPLCANVTHLSIFSVPLDAPIPPHYFPALTHLMGVYILDNTPPTSFIRSLRKSIRRLSFFDTDDSAAELERYPPLQCVVLNICNAPARPDYDKSLEIWSWEEELVKENVYMRPSERLTLTEWEREARGVFEGADVRRLIGEEDRWRVLERKLEKRLREVEANERALARLRESTLRNLRLGLGLGIGLGPCGQREGVGLGLSMDDEYPFAYGPSGLTSTSTATVSSTTDYEPAIHPPLSPPDMEDEEDGREKEIQPEPTTPTPYLPLQVQAPAPTIPSSHSHPFPLLSQTPDPSRDRDSQSDRSRLGIGSRSKSSLPHTYRQRFDVLQRAVDSSLISYRSAMDRVHIVHTY